MSGPTRFDVEVQATRDLRHAPYLLDGLAALEADGVLRMRIRPRPPRRNDRVVVGPDGPQRVARPYPWSTDLVVTDHDLGERRTVSVDLQDWRDMYSATSLACSDVVLKRMYTRPEVDVIEATHDVEVLPAGITAAGDSGRWSSRWPFRLAGLAGNVESVLDAPGDVLGRWRARRRYETAEASPIPAPTVPAVPDDYVLFQVAHHAWLGRPDSDALNQSRIDLIRALRAELGERFVGGMTFPRGVPEGWEDCRSEMPSTRDVYLGLVDRAAVVVSSNGFGGSPPWKLAEYLASGSCIVAEPPEVVLPATLEHGVHAWLAATPEEIASACRHLLDHPAERDALRRGASAYHADQVAPVALARRALTAGSEAPWTA
jgi:hypothetical protein